MNVLKPMPKADGPRVVPTSRDTALPPAIAPGAGRKTFRMFLVAALLVGGGVAFGMWQHSLAEAEVTATSEQRRGIVPAVRVTTVHANDGMTVALLPASTGAFEVADIMARISGYVAKRYVDIGDRVKADQLLAEISAPELDHQIAQAQATLALSEAALNQAKAKREVASVTWNRDSNLAGQGWITSQQADTERLNLRAQEAAVTVAQANIRAQQAQLEVLLQLKAYQRVVAPQHRQWQPGAGRHRRRHRDVHGDAQRRDPRPGLRTAGPGVRPAKRCRRHRARPRDAGPTHGRPVVVQRCDDTITSSSWSSAATRSMAGSAPAAISRASAKRCSPTAGRGGRTLRNP
jgi:Biotin-lipoyl like